MRRETLLKLVLEDGLTATAAARLLSLDVSTAMFWLAQAGHSTQRRAKVLGDERRKRLVADLLRGTDKAILARKYAVSEVTITRTLRTTPGLQAAWHAARLERARRQARARWSRLVTRHPGEGVKSLRAMAPAVFAWLYRNDGDWLANCNSQLGRKKSTPTGRVKWDERDRYLAAKIEAASSTLFVEGSGRLIARWQLCQLVPDLKPQLAHLRRLPLTARAIEIATRRPPEDTSLPLF
jgi:transposase